jgi:uncharacterized SAM-binding protein YcdF (DUF218 family)
VLFVLGKLLNAVLLPPGVFVVGLVLLAILATRARAPRSVRWLALALAGLLYLSSVTPTRALLVGPLERRYPPLAAGSRFDAVAVLAGGAGADAPERPGSQGLSGASLARLVHGWELARRAGTPIIVSGGDPLNAKGLPDAEIMRRELVALGASESAVIVEGRSRNTLENARFTLDICRARGLRRVVVVTSAVHMPRAMRCFRHFGGDALAAPTDYLGAGPVLSLGAVVPSADDMAAVVSALHEYFGDLYYRLAYGV